MENIINKYIDENGYILNLNELYNELKTEKYDSETILDIMKNVSKKNKFIIKELSKENEELKLYQDKSSKIIENNYVKEDNEVFKHKDEKKNKDEFDNRFYIQYIEENFNDNKFLDILPKISNKDSINIIDSILVYFLKEINFLKYSLVDEIVDSEIKYIIDNLNKYEYIYKMIISYKNELLTMTSYDNENNRNNVVYFMNGNIPYFFNDLDNDRDNIESILELIESIKNGTFKNIKAFTNNDKLKGLFEVRDLNRRTRVIFDILNSNKYCIIGVILNKTSTNSLYKERLNIRYKKYKDSLNIGYSNDIKRKLLGDCHE